MLSRRYVVDLVFLPERDGGVAIEVLATDPADAVQRATREFARKVPTVATEVDTVMEV